MKHIVFLGNRGSYKTTIAIYLSTGALIEKGCIDEVPNTYDVQCGKKKFILHDCYATRGTLPYLSYYKSKVFFIFRDKGVHQESITVDEFLEDIECKTNDNVIIVELEAPMRIDDVPKVTQIVLNVLSSMPY